MKILMNRKVGGAWGFITESFVNALVDKGHDVRRYDNNINSWNSFDPDIYIGCSGHREIIPKQTRTKKAIHVNPFGPITIQGINEQSEAVEWVYAQRPDAVFGYGGEHERVFWSYWTDKAQIPWVPMPTAGDKTIFKDLGVERDLDLVYLGGRWAYKAKTIDKYLIPAWKSLECRKMLHGNQGWSDQIVATELPDSEVTSFFNRGRVGPCMSEEHTQNYGIDIPERVWKIALCGVLPIHDPVPSLRYYLPSAIIAADPADYKAQIDYYVNNEDKRKEKALAVQKEVLENHTYHHRLAGLFRALGFEDEAQRMIE